MFADSRDRTLADDPDLDFHTRAEILLLIETLRKNSIELHRRCFLHKLRPRWRRRHRRTFLIVLTPRRWRFSMVQIVASLLTTKISLSLANCFNSSPLAIL